MPPLPHPDTPASGKAPLFPLRPPSPTIVTVEPILPAHKAPAPAPRFRFDPYSYGASRVMIGATPVGACARPDHTLSPVPPPYTVDAPAAPVLPLFEEAQPQAPHPADALPEGTLHTALAGKVTFLPYPSHAVDFGGAVSSSASSSDGGDEDAAAAAAKEGATRLFIGQLPFFVTDMQLAWLCHTFSGHVVRHPERIMKRQPQGDRLPTGCVHAYCDPGAADAIIQGVHKRVLVDDTGVWVADAPAERAALSAHIAMMKRCPERRFQNRPYDTVVVQFATSTYVPDAPVPLTHVPSTRASRRAQALAKKAAAAASAGPSSAPPQYTEAVRGAAPATPTGRGARRAGSYCH